MSTIHRRGVLLDGIGKELVRSANGGSRKTLSDWIGSIQDSIELEDLAETFTSGDATPDVSGSAKWITAGSTAITNFDGGTEGQVIHVYRGDSDIVITDNGNIDPIISGNLTLSATKPSASFRLASGVWKQVSESGAQSSAMAPVIQAGSLALGRTAFGVPGLADANTFTATNAFRRTTHSVANASFDLSSNVQGVMQLFSAGSTVTIGASKQLDVLYWSDTLVVGSAGIAHFGNCNLTIDATSHTSANVRGWVANLINQSAAETKAIYGRVEATGASSGEIVAYAGQVVPGASTSAAIGLQLAFDTTSRKVDYGIWIQPVSGTCSVDYAVLINDGVAVGQAGFAMFADGAGSLAKLFSGDGLSTLIDLTNAGAGKFAAGALPMANDGAALGSTSLMWSDLFLASGAVVNFNNGDVTITHAADTLAFAGGASGYTFSHLISPAANDGAALGSATVSWADLFLATGAVVNFANGNYTITHSSGTLAFSAGFTVAGAITPASNDGAALGSASVSWADLFLATGAVLNFANGNFTLTHSSGAITASGSVIAPNLYANSTTNGVTISQAAVTRNNSAGSLTIAAGSGAGNAIAFTTAGSTRLGVSDGAVTTNVALTVLSGTAIPAGGTAGAGAMLSSTANFGIFFGSGAPSLSAAKGSIYLRSDGSGTSDRCYVNTNGSTTWTAFTTAA